MRTLANCTSTPSFDGECGRVAPLIRQAGIIKAAVPLLAQEGAGFLLASFSWLFKLFPGTSPLLVTLGNIMYADGASRDEFRLLGGIRLLLVHLQTPDASVLSNALSTLANCVDDCQAAALEVITSHGVSALLEVTERFMPILGDPAEAVAAGAFSADVEQASTVVDCTSLVVANCVDAAVQGSLGVNRGGGCLYSSPSCARREKTSKPMQLWYSLACASLGWNVAAPRASQGRAPALRAAPLVRAARGEGAFPTRWWIRRVRR